MSIGGYGNNVGQARAAAAATIPKQSWAKADSVVAGEHGNYAIHSLLSSVFVFVDSYPVSQRVDGDDVQRDIHAHDHIHARRDRQIFVHVQLARVGKNKLLEDKRTTRRDAALH